MRQIFSLNDNWEFFFDTNDIKRTDGEAISLPHTYNAVDGQDGGGDYFKGTCVYKKTLSITPKKGKKYFLEFQGVSASAIVFIDGKKIGSHDGGYSTFRFDVTNYIYDGAELEVIVDNSKNDRVYPQNADFTFYGGIYRDVFVIEVNENHFDLLYHGSNGIFVTPTKLCDNTWNVNVKTRLIGSGEVEVTIGSMIKRGTDVDFIIENPTLWESNVNPYLYTATATLFLGSEKQDEISTNFGIRSFFVDKDKGFFLNDKSYPLRGVAMHQDRLNKGNAINNSDIEEDISLISEMGATTVRLSHYQHAQKTYELCDEKGLVVWTEIPYISEHLNNAEENAISQMTELIFQNYNHPSIFFWGLSNEITMAHGDNPAILPLHQKLNELCHTLDKTRLTALACISSLPTSSPLVNLTDVTSYNHYFGWYGGNISDNGKWFDEFHKTHPDVPIGMSEYGCENALWHSSHPEPGDYSNEYQMKYHENMINQLFSREYLFATHVWNMFDFGADMRDEGGTHGRNNKGLVTFDRKSKKDTFFAYKARLSKEPVLHLCSKEFVNRDGDETEFVVYSNLKKVSLYINDVLIEEKANEDCFFHFKITQPKNEYQVEVKADNLSESARFCHVDKFDESYTFGGATILNWFDIETPEGYFSVRDLMKDMQGTKAYDIAVEFGNKIKEHRAEELRKKEALTGKKAVVGGEGMSEEDSLKTMLEFSPLQFIKMGWPDMPKDEIIKINEAFNKIKKPKR